MATLFVIATPIGNLGDVTDRAQATLREVPLVLSEAPSKTRLLLKHLASPAKVIPVYSPGKRSNASAALQALARGQDVALVSEAGTPGVNDPGGALVAAVRAASYRVVPIPGPNAAITAASVSGFPMDNFRFMGFAPHKKGRTTFFQTIAAEPTAVIFYESPHRIRKTLSALAEVAPQRWLCVARELTKLHEQIVAERVDVINTFTTEQLPSLGEFVLVLAPADFVPQDTEHA